jgi:formylmethanofuran dehydrogenase subunit C
MTVRGLSQGGNAQNNLVHFTSAADLTLSGDLNNIWLDAVQAGGNVVVSGKLNTLVFMKDVATTITVTGTANTFYFPLGSALKLEGPGASSSTIRYFKP